MSEAPEKIWLETETITRKGLAIPVDRSIETVEYTRSDIAEAEIKQARGVAFKWQVHHQDLKEAADQRERALQAKYDNLLKALKDEGYEVGVVDGPELGE